MSAGTDARGAASEAPAPGPAGAYRASLPPGEVREFDLTGYDRTGLPVTATTWRSAGGGAAGGGAAGGGAGHGVGYGSDPAAAATGAWGEIAEQVLLDGALAELTPREASWAELVAERGADRVADPLTLVLPAGADADPDRPLLWLPATRWSTGEEVLVPAELLVPHASGIAGPPPSGSWLTTPITNGMGAGDTLERALGHALLELVQRDGNTVSFRALEQGAVIDTSLLTDPGTRSALDHLTAAGLDVTVRLASTELAVVVHAVAEDPLAVQHLPAGAGRSDVAAAGTSALTVTAVGEAAHPDRDVAIRKAVLELASSRARRAFAFGPLDVVRDLSPDYLADELAHPLPPQEERALAAMRAWTRLSARDLTALMAPALVRRTVVDPRTLPTAPELEAAGPEGLLAELLRRLAGFDVLLARTQVEVGDGRQVHVVRAVVPGLEVETLSYLRLGERVLRRLLDRGSPLVGLGAPTTADQLPVRLTAAATERLGGPAWLDRAAVAATVGDLYPLYREPTRHAPQRLG